MFSRRISYAIRKNRLALLLEEKKQSGTEILDLTESNPTQVGFSYPAEEILSALAHSRSLLYDPSPFGLDTARKAIANYYAERGQPVSSEDLLLTSSTSEAYSYLFKLLADPGDSLLVPQPSYPLFDFLAAGECVNTVPYPLIYLDGWQLHPEEIEGLINSRTRALVLVNPNNPTGSFIKPTEWTALTEICLRSRLPVICDEVFSDYCLDKEITPVDSVNEKKVLTFILSGFSKVVGLPQMKLGWIAITGPQHEKRQARRRLEIISDTFLSVSAPVQHAASTFLRLRPRMQKQIRKRLRHNLNILKKCLSGSAVEHLRVEGGWSAIVRFPRTRSDEEWALELLATHNVVVHPGYFYDFPEDSFLVISLLPEEEVFQRGLARLLEATK